MPHSEKLMECLSSALSVLRSPPGALQSIPNNTIIRYGFLSQASLFRLI